MQNRKKQFKLPSSVLAKAESLKLEARAERKLETAEDFYLQGVDFEESGDRWFSSDLSKSIRFYHRAHESYKKTLQMDPIMIDALFNMPRLEYDVYNKYTKDDSVVLEDLINCEDALNDKGPHGLFKDIIGLCKSCECTIDTLKSSNNEASIGLDIYLIVTLCYYEYIEFLCNDISVIENLNLDSELVKSIQRSIYYFGNLVNLVNNMSKNETNEENIDVESIVNIATESYKMVSNVYEILYSTDLIDYFNTLMKDFVNEIDAFSNEIALDLSIDNSNKLKISKLNELTSRKLDFKEFIELWNSDNNLNGLIEKQLVEGSSIRSFLDKLDEYNQINNLETPSDVKWEILTFLNNIYKNIVDIIKPQILEMEKSITSTENDVLSNKICLICSIFIERSDIDLERSLLTNEDAIKNQTILRNNSRNLLKNAIIFSKKTGGIRESTSGKLSRSKKQREAVMRLCLIDGKSQDEWDIILGEKYWPLELKELSNIDVYKKLFN